MGIGLRISEYRNTHFDSTALSGVMVVYRLPLRAVFKRQLSPRWQPNPTS